ncbi:unnamed protein product, partial [Aphanomyces euteiches]
MDRTRKGIRRRHDPDDDEIRLEMPPNKKALVELLENLCISMSTKDPVTIDEREENDAAAKFISSNGPRQYVYPRRNRYNLYTAYMMHRLPRIAIIQKKMKEMAVAMHSLSIHPASSWKVEPESEDDREFSEEVDDSMGRAPVQSPLQAQWYDLSDVSSPESDEMDVSADIDMMEEPDDNEQFLGPRIFETQVV